MNTIRLNTIGEIKSFAGGGSGGGGSIINKPIGVFIYTINGEFITSDDWNSAYNDKVVGVFVNDGEHDFVIATQDASDSVLKWGGNDKKLISIFALNSTEVKIDFSGASNTINIIKELTGYTDDIGILGAPACEACDNYTFINGNKGYLPSAAELNLAYANETAVDNAMVKCGGIKMSNCYWTSSQTDNYVATYSFFWGYGYISSYSRNNSCRVRAFCKI